MAHHKVGDIIQSGHDSFRSVVYIAQNGWIAFVVAQYARLSPGLPKSSLVERADFDSRFGKIWENVIVSIDMLTNAYVQRVSWYIQRIGE